MLGAGADVCVHEDFLPRKSMNCKQSVFVTSRLQYVDTHATQNGHTLKPLLLHVRTTYRPSWLEGFAPIRGKYVGPKMFSEPGVTA